MAGDILLRTGLPSDHDARRTPVAQRGEPRDDVQPPPAAPHGRPAPGAGAPAAARVRPAAAPRLRRADSLRTATRLCAAAAAGLRPAPAAAGPEPVRRATGHRQQRLV